MLTRISTPLRPRFAALTAGALWAAVAAGGGAMFAGCDDDPSPQSSASSLSEDLVPMAGGTAPSQPVAAAAGPGAPKVIYLDYADGTAPPATYPDPCSGSIAPKFVCSFAPTLSQCQQQVQTYLDKWYADFNVVFTLTRPTSGAFYSEVVSSGGGAWCQAPSTVAGIAPFYCSDLAGGVAYTFLGGDSAKETAIIIAQEQAHLVGLEHTLSPRDIMDATVCPNCDGFENVANQINMDHCGRATQNSYQMMLDRLGAWSGGDKPTPFGCANDQEAPSVSILTPAAGATVSSTFALTVSAADDCKVAKVSVDVEPLGLTTSSAAPPFNWTLSKISGRQTITVTASDPAGKKTSVSVTVNGPGSDGGAGAHADAGIAEDTAQAGGKGCAVAGGGAFGRRAATWETLTWLMFSVGLAARRPARALVRSRVRARSSPR